VADPALPRTGLALLLNDGTDQVTIYRNNIRAIGALLEAKSPLYSQGALSARPAAGTAGRIYKSTDLPEDNVLYWDTGAAWVAIGVGAAVDPAAGVGGLRTLGAAATQAAAGDHSHGVSTLVGAEIPALLTIIGAY
jgi:hypothetical protein